MSAHAPERLTDTQRRIWRLITHPEGVDARLREERGDPEAAPLDALLVSDARLSAALRLDVYANAYFYRILDVLQEDFPTLAHVMGEDAFHDLATSYLAVHPSRNPSLRWIGQRMPAFLATHEASTSFRERWPFASDLAALEWAMGEVFDAKDARATSRADLEGVEPELWESLALRLVPAVRLLALRWPVHLLRRAWRALEEPIAAGLALPGIAAAATALCVWRREEQIHERPIDTLEAEALRTLADGIRFGALCERIAARVGDDEAPARAAGWLARWVEDGLVAATDR